MLRQCKVLSRLEGKAEGLNNLWAPLTQALQNITERETELSSSTNPILSKLLPLIEAFFVFQQGSEVHAIFDQFCESNRKVINILVKQNPNLLNDTLNTIITHFPHLLDFDNKRIYFRSEMKKRRPDRTFDNIRL